MLTLGNAAEPELSSSRFGEFEVTAIQDAATTMRRTLFAALPVASAAEAMRVLAAGGVVAGESGAAGMGLLREAMLRPALAGLREAAGLNEHSRVLVFNTETATDAENYRAIVGTSAGQATSFEV